MPNPRLEPGQHGKVSITPWRGKFRARARWCDPATGQRVERSASGDTRRKAERALLTVLARPPLPARRELLAVFAERMFEQKQMKVDAGEMSPTSLHLYRGAWRRHIEPALGGFVVDLLTVPRCDAYLWELRKRLGPSTVSNVRTVLRQILQVAVIAGAVPSPNPIGQVSDTPGRGRKPVKALSAEEAVRVWHGLAALAAAGRCEPWVPDLWLWLLGTGDRISNALATRWAWIDMTAGVASLGPNVIRVPGEGLRLSEGTSKSRAVEGIELPSQVLTMLLARQTLPGYDPAGLVFPHPLGGYLDPNTVSSKRLRPALIAIGYGHVSSHWCRRTLGSALNDAGLTAKVIATQLRHTNQRTTERHYMAIRGGNPDVRAAIEAMLATEPEQPVKPLG